MKSGGAVLIILGAVAMFSCDLVPPDCDVYQGYTGPVAYRFSQCDPIINGVSPSGVINATLPAIDDPTKLPPGDTLGLHSQFAPMVPTGAVQSVLPEWNENGCFEENLKSGGVATFSGFYLEFQGRLVNETIQCCQCWANQTCSCGGQDGYVDAAARKARDLTTICPGLLAGQQCLFCVSQQNSFRRCALVLQLEPPR